MITDGSPSGATPSEVDWSTEVGWKRLQNDPNNWIEVPEIGVLPWDVDFVGFSLPILGYKDKHAEVKAPILEMVTLVRKEMQSRGLTLLDVKSANDKALDQGLFDTEFAGDGWSGNEIFAIQYDWLMGDLKRFLECWPKKPRESVVLLARAGAGLAEMLGNKDIDKITVQRLQKQHFSRAGAKGANGRIQLYEPLRVWTLENAKKHRGSPLQISRKLMFELPESLATCSKDPGRFMQRAIENEAKKS